MVNQIIKEVEKRDGTIVPFNQYKITNAIHKALMAVAENNGKKTYSIAQKVSDSVVGELETRVAEKGVRPNIESIQEVVQERLMIEGRYNAICYKAATAYIIYREQHRKIRDIGALLNKTTVEKYIEKGDWRIQENSNMGFSLQGLNNYISTNTVSVYWLNEIYPEKIRKAHENADIHIHDLGTLGAYCVGWDLEDLLITGFKGVSGKVESNPPRHLRTALGQIVNFFYTLQGETAGAQAFSNFDTLLAPFIRKDKLNYGEVKQCMQEFLFNLSVPTRVGFQTPFTNITMDLRVPDYIKDKPVIFGGKAQKENYGDFQKEMDMINKAFAENMLNGDAKGRIFTFPIPTYNITKDFDWDNPNYDLIWEMTAKYGIPYFSNFINSEMKVEDSRSMCCRLRLDQGKLRKRGGGLFGANPQTGSIGVVTINMPRLGFTSKNETDFLGGLERLMDIAKDSLEIKRKTLERFADEGLYPYSRFYLRNVKEVFDKYWKNHFSTIGLLGMNEAIMNLFPGEDIGTKKGRDFTIKVLDFMRGKLEKYQEETEEWYNLEATPAEGATYRFAKEDKETFPDIIVANEGFVRNGAEPFYTNSTHLPVNYTSDIFEALEIEDPLQIKYTGGTVFHTFLEERPKGENAKTLVKKIITNYKLPYLTITPTFSICEVHGYIAGDHEYCPKCESVGEKSECERWSRTVGYFRPVNDWNNGKREEFRIRKYFNSKKFEEIEIRV